MPVRTTMVKVGVWDVPNVGTRYRYRVCTVARSNREWTIYKQEKTPVLNTPEINPDGPPWEFVETGYKSKASAVEYVEELATDEN